MKIIEIFKLNLLNNKNSIVNKQEGDVFEVIKK
jgi:hypothetical protein